MHFLSYTFNGYKTAHSENLRESQTKESTKHDVSDNESLVSFGVNLSYLDSRTSLFPGRERC